MTNWRWIIFLSVSYLSIPACQILAGSVCFLNGCPIKESPRSAPTRSRQRPWCHHWKCTKSTPKAFETMKIVHTHGFHNLHWIIKSVVKLKIFHILGIPNPCRMLPWKYIKECFPKLWPKMQSHSIATIANGITKHRTRHAKCWLGPVELGGHASQMIVTLLKGTSHRRGTPLGKGRVLKVRSGCTVLWNS